MYSCACEQTEENGNMLFVVSAMRNIQKLRRDLGVASSVRMNWWSLVTMSYAICNYVLTCRGAPGIIWEVHSCLNVRKVVPSVRGCLMWGISEWVFLSRKFMVLYFWSPGRVIWECGRLSVIGTWTDSGGWKVDICVIQLCRWRRMLFFLLVDGVGGWTSFNSERQILSEI